VIVPAGHGRGRVTGNARQGVEEGFLWFTEPARSPAQVGGLVAVVSDGSGLRAGVAVDRRSLAGILRKDSELIGPLTGLTVITPAITAGERRLTTQRRPLRRSIAGRVL